MDNEIDKIIVQHYEDGVIEINSSISKKVSNLIGTIAHDYNMYCYYYANMTLNEDGTINVKDLNVVKSEKVIVGGIKRDGVYKNYVKLFKNKLIHENIIFYPKSIGSVIYKNLN